jgi:hypothetical protein
MVGLQQISFGEVALLFICQKYSLNDKSEKRTLSSVFLFLLLLLVFSFCLDFYSDLLISFYQGVFLPLDHVGLHQKSWI